MSPLASQQRPDARAYVAIWRLRSRRWRHGASRARGARVAPGRPVLLYDGRCRFCILCVRALAVVDRRHRIARLSFHRPEADRLLATLAAQQRRTAVHLVVSGRVISGGPAVRESLAIALGGGRLARVLDLGPIAHATDLAYRVVAGRRRWISLAVLWGGLRPPDDFP